MWDVSAAREFGEKLMEKITVVNLMSLPFSGGTWLNLMLGASDAAFSVGEYRDVIYKGNRAECVTHDQACEVWPRIDTQGGENVFVQLAEVTGKRVLIVNSSRKTFGWQRDERIRPVIVYLHRDVRALVASSMRKKVHASVWQAIKSYAHEELRLRKTMYRSGFRPIVEIAYEQLKHDAAGSLEQISTRLDIPFNAGQVNYWKKDHCYIGGNRGTLLNMLVEQDKKAEHILEKQKQSGDITWEFDYYNKKGGLKKFRDERWRSELKGWRKCLVDVTLLPLSKIVRMGV